MGATQEQLDLMVKEREAKESAEKAAFNAIVIPTEDAEDAKVVAVLPTPETTTQAQAVPVVTTTESGS